MTVSTKLVKLARKAHPVYLEDWIKRPNADWLAAGGWATARDKAKFPIKKQHRPLVEAYRTRQILIEVLYGAPQTTIPSSITAAIEASKYIYDLQDDWDEEGSIGYQKATWERATDLIMGFFDHSLGIDTHSLPAPNIAPGPDGSIDIHWQLKNKNRELLINIPADPQSPAVYYGTGGPNDVTKGKLELSSQNSWIIRWLMK